MKWWISAVAIIIVAMALLRYHTTPFPERRIDDTAGLLHPEQQQRISEFHRYLLTDHDIDYRILIRQDLGDINDFAWRHFHDTQVGSSSQTGRGLLLVIDPAQNRLRLETSRALESVYPDAFVAYIEQRQMVPFFRSARIADGILATTELIVGRAQGADTDAAWDDEVRAQSSGGGAAAEARIDAGAAPKSRHGISTAPVDDRHAVVNAYIEAMRNRNNNPDLPIYSAASRRMFAGWTVTPAQMDNIVRSFFHCQTNPTQVFATDERTVIRYPIDARACNPWFLVHEQESWRLDFTVMQNLIRFGRDNSWHFVSGDIADSPYAFAFADWRLDRRGYPRENR